LMSRTRRDDNDDSFPIISWDTPNENEQRVLGGFFVESPLSYDDIEFVQVELPVGAQRVANVLGKDIETDMPIEDALAPSEYSGKPQGFPNEKELSDRYGFAYPNHMTKIDAVVVTNDTVYVTEVKTTGERISGLSDINKGFGQVLMNRDRFVEDYPSVAEARELRGLLVAEESDIDVELIRESFSLRDVSFFDPLRGGFLLGY